MRAVLAATAAAAAALLATSAPRAQEPSGCDKFRWPIEAEAKALTGAVATVANGAELRTGPQGNAVALLPLAGAGLALPPERAPRGEAPKAAFVRYAAPPRAGLLQVTTDAAVWIDLVQDGGFVRPAAFSGAVDCPGVRKTVRFTLDPKPFVRQFSGAGLDRVRFVVASPSP